MESTARRMDRILRKGDSGILRSVLWNRKGMLTRSKVPERRQQDLVLGLTVVSDWKAATKSEDEMMSAADVILDPQRERCALSAAFFPAYDANRLSLDK